MHNAFSSARPNSVSTAGPKLVKTIHCGTNFYIVLWNYEKKCLWDDGAEWTLPCKARNTDLPVSLLLLGPLKSGAKESFRWCKYFDVKKISGRKIRPHRRYKGREHPDGISQMRFGFIWERRGIFWKKTSVFGRS